MPFSPWACERGLTWRRTSRQEVLPFCSVLCSQVRIRELSRGCLCEARWRLALEDEPPWRPGRVVRAPDISSADLEQVWIEAPRKALVWELPWGLDTQQSSAGSLGAHPEPCGGYRAVGALPDLPLLCS